MLTCSILLYALTARRATRKAGFRAFALLLGGSDLKPVACYLSLIRGTVALEVLHVALLFLLVQPLAEGLGLLLGGELGPDLRLDLAQGAGLFGFRVRNLEDVVAELGLDGADDLTLLCPEGCLLEGRGRSRPCRDSRGPRPSPRCPGPGSSLWRASRSRRRPRAASSRPRPSASGPC